MFLVQVNEDTITSLLEKEEEQTPSSKRLKLTVPTGAKLEKMVGNLVLFLHLLFNFAFQTRWVRLGRWERARKSAVTLQHPRKMEVTQNHPQLQR